MSDLWEQLKVAFTPVLAAAIGVAFVCFIYFYGAGWFYWLAH